MAQRQTASLLPVPSSWQILVIYGNKLTNVGTLKFNSIIRNNVTGSINFRGVPVPIRGTWNEQTQQIHFQSPYAIFSGRLTTYKEPGIMHYTLSGRYASTASSDRPGDVGTWTATTASFYNM